MARTDRHLVVDGSNIATEGRTLPSLAQLDEAVRAIADEFPYESLTVIVDATFAHRIDDSEREEFEAAVLAGEIVAPPAGAIGRGDAFILQVADKVDAVVFSNDSFQEFHGEHEWLFHDGRLIGGKPIEGVGWVFVERSPVRGPASRRAVREAGGRRPATGKRPSRSRSSAALGPAPTPSTATPPPPRKAPAARATSTRTRTRPAASGTASTSTARSTAGTSTTRSTASTAGTSTARSTARSTASRPGTGSAGAAGAAGAQARIEELNDTQAFMRFVSKYSIGDQVAGTIERFSSHGCYLRAASARCYLPSRAMGDPPPTRARDVVSRGQDVIVRVESLDSDRRGINVALVRVVEIDDEEQVSNIKQGSSSKATSSRRRNPAKPPQEPTGTADEPAREGYLTRSRTTVATTKAAKKTARKKPAAKKRTTTKKAATATSSARAEKAAAKRSPTSSSTRATTPKKAAAATTTAKAPARKATTRKAAATTTAKAPARKATTKATTRKANTATANTATTNTAKATTKATTSKAPAKKAATKAATKKAATAKATTKATTSKAPARKATTRKAATRKAPVKKAATKAATKRATTARAAKKAAG